MGSVEHPQMHVEPGSRSQHDATVWRETHCGFEEPFGGVYLARGQLQLCKVKQRKQVFWCYQQFAAKLGYTALKYKPTFGR